MTDRPSIKPTENGPYRLEGASEIVRMRDGEAIALKPRAFLCRCGGSQNKPFCDGTHARNGFSGAKDPDRVPNRRESYTSSSGDITIHDDRGLCAHAARCSDQLAAVFRTGTEPWIDPDGATAEEIAAVVASCPSGALSYTMGGAERRDHGGSPSIGFEPGGPYMLSGGIGLLGVEMPDGGTEDHYALCRCGASQNKPFCSGKHWDVEFDEDQPG
jgi:CDGSH-type Zn-finger protein